MPSRITPDMDRYGFLEGALPLPKATAVRDFVIRWLVECHLLQQDEAVKAGLPREFGCQAIVQRHVNDGD